MVWDKILFEGKAAKNSLMFMSNKVLNYLAASKLRLGLFVNFGGDTLERVVL